MKIARVEAIPLMARPKKPYTMPHAKIDKFFATIVKITTDDEITGVGECTVRLSPRTTQSIVEDILAPVVIGRDPEDVEAIWWDMFKIMRGRGHSRGFMLEAISGIDMAIWDILGKYRKASIGKLLGGYDRKTVKVYASSIMLNDLHSSLKEAEMLVEKGFRSIKIKVGMGIDRDIKTVSAIRDVVGSEVELMVDANSAYDLTSAIAAGQGFEDLGIAFFEEPLPPDNIADYKMLRKKINIPIAIGESEFTVFGFKDFLESNCIDIVQPDVSRAGGYTECRKIANFAGIYNKQYSPHTGFSSSICIFASMQLAAYAVNFVKYEYMYLDNPLQDIMKDPIPKVIDGEITIPKGYGLGAEIDEAAIEKFRLR